MTSLNFKRLDTWVKKNRYSYADVARHFDLASTTVNQWKFRGFIPGKYRPQILKIIAGKRKLTH